MPRRPGMPADSHPVCDGRLRPKGGHAASFSPNEKSPAIRSLSMGAGARESAIYARRFPPPRVRHGARQDASARKAMMAEAAKAANDPDRPAGFKGMHIARRISAMR